ncbi:hypothetical protein COCNU_01G017270 [Cocos nucifera]|uniref:Uncharacterized protein n=1 Tax=Cocos nucifera TaxID=13894 RepID=A0A8K0MVL5_COCNU|nr:hypothetical protein [Cocos nucifera]KAG1327793.1 hypothetical protein COCNU_01G017270 [Cocos nucifera]
MVVDDGGVAGVAKHWGHSRHGGFKKNEVLPLPSWHAVAPKPKRKEGRRLTCDDCDDGDELQTTKIR